MVKQNMSKEDVFIDKIIIATYNNKKRKQKV
jgi:hypothetical protein